MRLLLLLCLMFCLASALQAQNTKIYKNTLYINRGSGLWVETLSLSYERNVWATPSVFKNIHLYGESGLYAAPFNAGIYGGTGLVGLTGSKNGHFELQLGLISYFYFSDENDISVNSGGRLVYHNYQRLNFLGIGPNIKAGYRYQKPSGRFMFRVGVGEPELLYLGGGFRF